MDVPEVESRVLLRETGVPVPLVGALVVGNDTGVEIGEEGELAVGVVDSGTPSSGVARVLIPLRLELMLPLVLGRPPLLPGLGMYLAVQLRFFWFNSETLMGTEQVQVAEVMVRRNNENPYLLVWFLDLCGDLLVQNQS